eukprot:1162123-Pelagomonas_calceolata.AAC.10
MLGRRVSLLLYNFILHGGEGEANLGPGTTQGNKGRVSSSNSFPPITVECCFHSEESPGSKPANQRMRG